MSEFKIDFFELAFLAEACIPPRPIARTMFWQHLTDMYWEQMTEGERERLFEWLNRDDKYKRSLESEEETKIFHARFDPDNQYIVHTEKHEKPFRAYLFDGRYWIKRNTWIMEDAIIKVEKNNKSL